MSTCFFWGGVRGRDKYRPHELPQTAVENQVGERKSQQLWERCQLTSHLDRCSISGLPSAFTDDVSEVDSSNSSAMPCRFTL